MSEMSPLAENQGVPVLPSETATYATAMPTKTPRGYTFTFALSAFGIYVALLAPVYGALSVKIQGLASLEAAPVLLGIVTGAGALFSSIVQPIAGRLSDRSTSKYGMRRPFIFFGVLFTAIFLIACGLAPNYPLLLLFWCLVQISCNFALAAQHTTLADQVPEAKRGGVSGIIGAVTPGAILGGSILIAVMPSDFLRFAVPAIFGLITVIIFVLVLKDRVRTNKPATKMNLKQIFGSYMFHPRQNPDFGWAWLSKALILLGFGATSTYITLFLATSFGMNTTEQLSFNAIAQVASILPLVIFSVIFGYVSDKVGRRKPFVLASGLVLGCGCHPDRRVAAVRRRRLDGAPDRSGRHRDGRGRLLRRRPGALHRGSAQAGRDGQGPRHPEPRRNPARRPRPAVRRRHLHPARQRPVRWRLHAVVRVAGVVAMIGALLVLRIKGVK